MAESQGSSMALTLHGPSDPQDGASAAHPSVCEPGHAEDGHLEPTVGPDWDAIDRGAFHVEPESDDRTLTPEQAEAACRMFASLVEWIWQSGMKNPEGITIRAIIVCWRFVPELGSLTLTEMARGFGKKKQSLGRWVDDFKRRFPFLVNCHMKNQ